MLHQFGHVLQTSWLIVLDPRHHGLKHLEREKERDGEESQSQRGRKHDRERQKGETKMQRGSERTKIIQISYRKSFSLSYFHLNIQ